MEMGSTRVVLAVAICAFCATLLFSPSTSAQSTSTRPADLVNNEKVIYELPDIGSISPENPLFILKRVRDEIMLALPQETTARAKLLVQLSDKYNVYADKLTHLSKTQRSTQMFETAMGYLSTAADILREEQKKPDSETHKVLTDLQYIALQSNIKQAEMIRSLIDEIPESEQPAFVGLLEKNMQLRKKLQGT